MGLAGQLAPSAPAASVGLWGWADADSLAEGPGQARAQPARAQSQDQDWQAEKEPVDPCFTAPTAHAGLSVPRQKGSLLSTSGSRLRLDNL